MTDLPPFPAGATLVGVSLDGHALVQIPDGCPLVGWERRLAGTEACAPVEPIGAQAVML